MRHITGNCEYEVAGEHDAVHGTMVMTLVLGSSGHSIRHYTPRLCNVGNKNGVPSKRAFIQNHGIFKCEDCAHAHNTLGLSIITVKSVYATTLWSEEELILMESSGGNEYTRKVLGAHIPHYWRRRIKLNIKSTIVERMMCIRLEPACSHNLWNYAVISGPLLKVSECALTGLETHHNKTNPFGLVQLHWYHRLSRNNSKYREQGVATMKKS